MNASVEYRVTIPRPDDHTLHLSASFVAPNAAPELHLAAWTPGSYLIREFSRYLGEASFCDADGAPLNATRTAKGSWRVQASAGARVTARWTAYCHELTVRTPHVDGTHAFFTGTNVLLRVEGLEAAPSSVTVQAPAGWTTFCALPQRDGAWLAEDWDTLADTPFEIGPHRSHTFDIDGIPHRLVFWGDDAVAIDVDRLTRDTAALVRQNAAIFGGELPYTNYDFVFHITANGRGGLEHLNSTVLATPWAWFDTDDGYRELLGLIAHEHFHVWNVKRIKPAGLVPFDYQAENYTSGLWVSEGFTSYLDDFNCLRAGVLEPNAYLGLLSKQLTRLEETPGRLAQSVADASFDAWIRLYRPDENTPNRTVSYYLKGAMVALLIDLHIRAATGAARSIDDVMRRMWDDWRETGTGFAEDGVAHIIARATGVDLAEQLAAWTNTTAELPLEAALADHGISLEREPSTGVDLGVSWTRGADLVVRHITPGGPADAAGLYPNDVVVALAGRRTSSSGLDQVLASLRVGDRVPVHLFRRERLLALEITAAAQPPGAVVLKATPNASPAVVALRDRWLGPGISEA